MSLKIVLFCAQAFLMQSITAQYVGNAYSENVAWNTAAYPGTYESYAPNPISYAPNAIPYASNAIPYASNAIPYASNAYANYAPSSYNPANLAASNACGLSVSSSSPIAPVGVTMASQNAFEGPLAVAGQIPFLGAVGVEGLLPTAGAGAISYGSGNGQVAMLAEDLGGYGYPAYSSYGAAPGYAYGSYY